MMNKILRVLFFRYIVRPFVFFVATPNVRHRERLPRKGPAILVANHNSHLDTLALMTLAPKHLLHILRPVAAADYFLKNRFIAWFSLGIINIVPVKRAKDRKEVEDLLQPLSDVLEKDEILILYPEGTRGEPERMSDFKTGVARLAEKHPKIPVFPIFLHGFGKVWPRGGGIFVPFNCDVVIGEARYWNGDQQKFLEELKQTIINLSEECHIPNWE